MFMVKNLEEFILVAQNFEMRFEIQKEMFCSEIIYLST